MEFTVMTPIGTFILAFGALSLLVCGSAFVLKLSERHKQEVNIEK